jgi:DAACS family dicarboxylate/amino acid:cation (Na+ or H+) symporter
MGLGLVVGAGAGLVAHAAAGGSRGLEVLVAYATEPVGAVFLRLLFMLVLPLVVSALALAIAELRDVGRLGRIGARTLACTVAVSAVAVGIGTGLVNVVRPGEGLSPDARAALLARGAARAVDVAPAGATGVGFLVGLVPQNVVRAMADGDMLAVLVFALLLGVGLALTPTPAARSLERGLQGLYDVTMRLLDLVIRMAPVAVACLLFTVTARLGFDVVRQLGWFVATVVGALALHQFGVYALAVRWFGGLAPRAFYRAIRPAMVTAFSTSSSNATLPTALQVADEGLRLPPHVSRFVLTLGSTANQNGTALFEGVTVLFLAQLYGVDLALGQQLLVMGIAVLGGIGTAGVPGGSLPVVAMILGMVGVPPDGIGIVLGVDRLLDMCRTTVNVTGDLVVATVVARGEPPLSE